MSGRATVTQMAASPHGHIAAVLQAAASRLGGRSDNPRLDAEILLAHVIGKSRSHLHTWPEQVLPEPLHRRFLELIARRLDGEPIAYLTGQREFWSLPLVVNRHTLIPRSETECLVELALDRIPVDRAVRIADIGTGSGAIALAVATERPLCRLIATDISSQALEVAKHNAVRLNLGNVEFRAGNGLEPLRGERLDVICSNPPYIAEGDPRLLQGDLPAEPRTALVAGRTGLELIETLARGARTLLREDGWLLLEHGYDQGGAVTDLLASLGYRAVTTYRDQAGHLRVSVAQQGI